MPEEINSFIFLVMSFLVSISMSFLICKLLIKIQRRKKLSQPIHQLGVKKHFEKSGTPSLGGIAIFISTFILFIILCFKNMKNIKLLTLLLCATGFFLVGLFDDLIKIFRKNEKGLSATLRIGLEVALVLATLVFMHYDESFMLYLNVYPLNYKLPLGIIIILLVLFATIGAANSSNLMDGLDGLNGGIMLVAFAPILILALNDNHFEIGILISLVLGSLIGFLLLNCHPAKIFMGDCGSLYLGSLLSLVLIYLDKLILLPLIGVLYVIEALSVILQVIYFKSTKRRILLMAPLHHHFELKAIPEYKIVMGYFLVQSIISILVVFMGVLF